MTDTCLTDVEQFFQVVQQSGLLEAHELNAWRARRDLAPTARDLATQMVREGVLTKFQGNRLLEGKYHGFVIGAYKVMQLLLEGKKDAVFLAWHATMNRHVALKIIKHNESDCKVTRERFMREARITASLSHAHIVKLFDIVEENGLQYLIMEYVEGSTLKQLLDQKGPMTVQQAVEYIRQAALGLNYAHQNGFVHRDIKPSNLILSNKGLVKILDMGHSRLAEDDVNITELYTPAAVIGTVDYIAPEITLGGEYTVISDVYSLGATLFTLIAGKPPFQGNSYQVLMAHQVEEVPVLPGVPSRVQSLVVKMMAKKPEDRHQSVQEVIDALTALQVQKSQPKVPRLPAAISTAPTASAKQLQTSKPLPRVTSGSKPGMPAMNTGTYDSQTHKPLNAPHSKEVIRRASSGAFRPVVTPAPATRSTSWSKTLIAGFIVAVLAGVGLLMFLMLRK